MMASPPTPVVDIPQPLARPKQPTLLQELRHHSAQSLASEQAGILATGKARLWWLAAGASLGLAVTIAQSHPRHWLPISYVGGSVAVALSTGALLEGAKGKTHHGIAQTIQAAQPLRSLAESWLTTEDRQLKGFDKLVSQYLFEEWRGEQSTVTVTAQPVPPSSVSVAEDLGRHPQSSLIGGVPGAGKGVVYLQALSHLKQHHPNTRTMLINPKQSGLELGTASAPALVLSRDFSNGGTPDELALWLWDCIEQFKSWEGPKLLIIDEMASIMATLKLSSRSLQILGKFRAFLSHITSMGDSESHYLWLISQDCSTDGLGISSALRSTLRAIGIVSPKNRQALGAFLSGGWLPVPNGGRAELDQIMQASEVGRAIFDGKQGRWLPMARLENLTGWDRDAGKPVQVAIAATPQWAEGDMEIDYFEVWEEFLSNRPDKTCTVREACQLAPRQVRTTAEGTREAFKQLEKMKFGYFCVATDRFTVATQ